MVKSYWVSNKLARDHAKFHHEVSVLIQKILHSLPFNRRLVTLFVKFCWTYLKIFQSIFNCQLYFQYSASEQDVMKAKLEERVGLKISESDRPKNSKLYK